MAIIRHFLCWSDTRKGSAFSAFYCLAVSAIELTWYLVRYISMGRIDDASEFRAITFAAFGVYCLAIISSLIMIPGIFLDQRYMFCPWLLVMTLVLLFEIGAIGLLTTAHLQIDEVLSPWEITGVLWYLVRTVMNVYCLICVISQYQELSEGRGTYDYLYKNDRPRVPASLTDSSLVEFASPPPPYSPEDPMKEFAPPAYSNPVATSPDSIHPHTCVYDMNSGVSDTEPRTSSSGVSSVLYCNRTYQSDIPNDNPMVDERIDSETLCDSSVFSDEAACESFSNVPAFSIDATTETRNKVYVFSGEAANETISEISVSSGGNANETISDATILNDGDAATKTVSDTVRSRSRDSLDHSETSNRTIAKESTDLPV